MRIQHQIISLLGLFFCFGLVFVGIFLFLPPFIPYYAQILQNLVINHLIGLSYFGLSLFCFALIFLSLLTWLNQRRYLLLEMGTLSVDEEVVALYANDCLKKIYPEGKAECSVVVHGKKKIEILADLPFVEVSGRSEMLQLLEEELREMLLKYFHYNQAFVFNVSFKRKESSTAEFQEVTR